MGVGTRALRKEWKERKAGRETLVQWSFMGTVDLWERQFVLCKHWGTFSNSDPECQK